MDTGILIADRYLKAEGALVFGFGKKAAFRQIEGCVNGTMVAMAEAMFAQVNKDERERQTVAAVANFLLLRSSPSQTTEERRLVERRAAAVLQANDDIRHAAVMCLRALSVTRGLDFSTQAMHMIDWVSTFGSIPAEPATYDNMHKLEWYMAKKYCPQAVQR